MKIRHFNKLIKLAGLTLAAIVSGLVSCNRIENLPEQPSSEEIFGENLPEENLLHQMNICVEDSLLEELENATGEDGLVDLSEFPQYKALGVVKMRRLFPDAGEFEARTRQAGLHRWYILDYDENQSMTKAATGLAFPGVSEIEYCPRMEIIGNPEVVDYAAGTKATGATVFNDPMLSSQWHYYNNGSTASSVSGCDINVVPVWKNYSNYVKYSGDIVVGVVDGGIDYNHEDLKDNMWHNPDKTGDNIYGYNFATSSYAIHAEDHGTHVAGTIAAVNNNGTGVCGVAGGNAAKKIKGAKLMSCQIFDGKKQGNGAEAIKWSADHGAHISQNSWGYINLTTTPNSLKQAVDYFIANAGVDSNGNQTGPMKGGVVIFAAGNENADVSGNDYEKIINVTSVGADYKRAYYSNFGSWCDISAPGGDAKKGNQVLSTLPGNKYGKMQGTSMACPHVSGVAALILARYGAKGYTPTAFTSKLLGTATDISAQNPSYFLGKGLVNAYKAVAGSGGKAPNVPTELTVSAVSNNIHFSVKVPSDEDDGKPSSIYIYYSTSDFSSSKNKMFGMFYIEDIPVGGTLEGVISGTDFETEYYIAAAACDLAGNTSALSQRVRVTTGSNTKPVITPLSAVEFAIKAYETAVAEFSITEPDGHYYSIDLEPGSDAATLDTLVRETPKIRITGKNAPEGRYTARLIVTDYYGLSSSAQVSYTILPNSKPVIVKLIENQQFTSKTAGTRELNASDYFDDPDGEQLSYTFSLSNPNVANMTYGNGKFYLTPMSYGNSDIQVTGTDVRGESVSSSFKVMVTNGTVPVTVYPNPVIDVMYIRIGSAASEMKVKVVGASGAVVADSAFENVSPFEPAKVDLSGCAPGNYTVAVTIDGELHKSNIVKL